jgi:hypothetical protein
MRPLPLVPTLCVGMQSRTLCVIWRLLATNPGLAARSTISALEFRSNSRSAREQQVICSDAERRDLHSHAERGNEKGRSGPRLRRRKFFREHGFIAFDQAAVGIDEHHLTHAVEAIALPGLE